MKVELTDQEAQMVENSLFAVAKQQNDKNLSKVLINLSDKFIVTISKPELKKEEKETKKT